MSEGQDPAGVAEAAYQWLAATVADPAAMATANWFHDVRDSGGPQPVHFYDHDVDGWTVRLTAAAWTYVSGFGSYLSASTRLRFSLTVLDPDGDVKGTIEDCGEQLAAAFQAVATSHAAQGRAQTENFRSSLQRATPGRVQMGT